MAYTPTTWVTGDDVTATKLNKIENGIANAGSALICNTSYSGNNYVLDKTAQEIYDAILGGTPVYIKYQYGTMSDYVGHLYLVPVVRIFNYDYTNEIKIIAVRPSGATNIGSDYGVSTSGTIIYSAGGLNEYPTFYKSIGTNANTTVQNVSSSVL